MCTRTTTRIRRHAYKEHKKQDPKPRRQKKSVRIGVLPSLSVCGCVSVSIYVSRISMHGIPTRVRSHLTYSLETSVSRSCDIGSNGGILQIFFVYFFILILSILNFEPGIHVVQNSSNGPWNNTVHAGFLLSTRHNCCRIGRQCPPGVYMYKRKIKEKSKEQRTTCS